MSSPVVEVHCDAPDPAVQPSTFTQACAIIDSLLRGNLAGADAYIPYILSNTTPGVDDQDKVWIQTDAAGRPIAIKTFYAGNWRPVYSGNTSEVKMFTGDPAVYFDTTGRGKTGLSWDGWALMNGQNGTPNWTDRFIVGAHMDNSAGVAMYAAGWRTNVAPAFGPLAVGGKANQTLTPDMVPQAPQAAVVVDLYAATGDGRSATGAMFGKHAADGSTPSNGQVELIAAVPGNSSPTPVYTLPPFVVAAYCLFVGYL